MGADSKHKSDLLPKPGKNTVLAIAVTGLLATIATAIYTVNKTTQAKPSSSVTVSKQVVKIDAVTALGRLQPKGEVIVLSPPPDLGGAKIERLYVEEGDTIQANQVIAILDSQSLKQAALEVANRDVAVAKANLAIVKAGAKTGEINAQRATVRRWQAELKMETEEQNAKIDRLKAEFKNAEKEFQRYEQLAQDGAVSASALDTRRLTLDTASKKVTEAEASYRKTIDSLSKQIEEASANLDRVSEVRPVDVQKAQAELDKSIAALNEAKENLENTYIRAPFKSQVLKINARQGEMVKQDEGVVELGQTDRMMVVAEVYESDISKVKLGQKAIVTSESGAFNGKLTGKISQIGMKIGKKDVLDTDPAADTDSRVVEVKILLSPEDSKVVAGLTYSKVIAKVML